METPLYHLLDDERDNRIFIKRDDLIPISFGGNKARKALYFYREIDRDGYDCVVTYGTSSSNHCRVIANLARGRGLPCYIIGPQEVSAPTANSRMMELFGARITLCPVDEVHDRIEQTLEQLRREGKRPYFIQGGGHGNLGTQAYVDCYAEIRQFEKQNGIFFSQIFLASGTGTTQAGLVCGALLEAAPRRIVGISIARPNPRGRAVVVQSVEDYLREQGAFPGRDAVEQRVVFLDDYIGSGYATDAADVGRTIREVLERYGIPMDPVYVGKAFSGMKQQIAREGLTGENILFLHTGGTPLFFDYLNRN